MKLLTMYFPDITHQNLPTSYTGLPILEDHFLLQFWVVVKDLHTIE